MEQSIRLLLWLYKSKINSKGLAPLFLRITIDGQKTEISIGISIAIKQWDAKKGHIKGNNEEARELNKKLGLLKSRVLKAANSQIERGTPVSAEQLKRLLVGKDNEAKTLLEAFEYHNRLLAKKMGIEVSKATLGKYETLLKKVKGYIEYQGRKDIFLKELNHQFVIEFELYLKTDHKLSHNPAIKYIQFFKKIIHLSVANGWINSDPFRNFKCNLITKERGYLTMQELNSIVAKSIEIKRINIVRDMFVFSCFTGLSYADLKKLCCKHIDIKEDDTKWIIINRTFYI